MLSAADINNPNSKNLKGEHIRRVIKHRFTTNTTIGTLSSFMFHVCKYFVTGHVNSVEVVILPYDNNSITFSRGGDSGALIINPQPICCLAYWWNKQGNQFVGPYLRYTMEWVWDLIKGKFPGTNLYLDDLEGFLADMF